MLNSQRNATALSAKCLPQRTNPMPDHIKTQDDLARAMKDAAKAEGHLPQTPAFKNVGGASAEKLQAVEERRQRLWAEIQKRPGQAFTAGMAAKWCGVDSDKARSDLAELANRGLVERTGDKINSQLLWRAKGAGV